jgi:hypothetical protein
MSTATGTHDPTYRHIAEILSDIPVNLDPIAGAITIAEILSDIPEETKKSLLEYLSDDGIFRRLSQKLEISAVSLESNDIRINLFHDTELGILKDLLEIQYGKKDISIPES